MSQKGFRFLFFNGDEPLTPSSAGDTTVMRKSAVSTVRINAGTGSGSYTRNIILSKTKATLGDVFRVAVLMPATNAVIVLKNWDGTAFDGMTFTAGEGTNHYAEFSFDGTDWKYSFGG